MHATCRGQQAPQGPTLPALVSTLHTLHSPTCATMGGIAATNTAPIPTATPKFIKSTTMGVHCRSQSQSNDRCFTSTGDATHWDGLPCNVTRSQREERAHRIEGLLHGSLEHGAPQLRLHVSITSQQREHGGHVGVDHARPLGHPPQRHRGATQLELQRTALGHQVYSSAKLSLSNLVKILIPFRFLSTLKLT